MKSAVRKTCLDNGIRILTEKMAHVRSVCMGVWVNVGARDESSSESGLSHFLEHMIFKGTRKRTGYQIAKEFDAIGGQTNAFTSMENTCYHARVMDTHLDTMVTILSDIFLNSVFAAEEIEKERPVIFQEIGMVEDSPDEYIHLLSGKTHWGEHPLGRSILGSRENVAGFDADLIEGFFRRSYQPEQIVISAAGNVEHERFVETIRETFESVSQENDPREREMPTLRPSVNIEHRDLEQVHLCLGLEGLSITDPQRYTLSLMDTVFGGNMSSRLFQEIRENRGLAYSVYSFASSYHDTGMYGVSAGVGADKALETVEVILKEIEKLKKSSVTETELRNAKEYTKGNLLLAAESNVNGMVRLAQGEILHGKHIPLAEVADRIDKVTAEDLALVVDNLFQMDRMTLTMLGPIRDEQPYKALLA
jgi:predicted Zn-dependent peptidase